MTVVGRVSLDGTLTVKELVEGSGLSFGDDGTLEVLDIDEVDADAVSISLDGKIICRELVEEDLV